MVAVVGPWRAVQAADLMVQIVHCCYVLRYPRKLSTFLCTFVCLGGLGRWAGVGRKGSSKWLRRAGCGWCVFKHVWRWIRERKQWAAGVRLTCAVSLIHCCCRTCGRGVGASCGGFRTRCGVRVAVRVSIVIVVGWFLIVGGVLPWEGSASCVKSVLDGIVCSAGKGFGYLCGLVDDICYFPRFDLTEVWTEILSHLRPLVSNRSLHCGKNQVLLSNRK